MGFFLSEAKLIRRFCHWQKCPSVCCVNVKVFALMISWTACNQTCSHNNWLTTVLLRIYQQYPEEPRAEVSGKILVLWKNSWGTPWFWKTLSHTRTAPTLTLKSMAKMSPKLHWESFFFVSHELCWFHGLVLPLPTDHYVNESSFDVVSWPGLAPLRKTQTHTHTQMAPVKSRSGFWGRTPQIIPNLHFVKFQH